MKISTFVFFIFTAFFVNATELTTRAANPSARALVNNITSVESQAEVVTIGFALLSVASSVKDAEKVQAQVKILDNDLEMTFNTCDTAVLEDDDAADVINAYSALSSQVEAMTLTVLTQYSEIRSVRRVSKPLFGTFPSIKTKFQDLGACLLTNMPPSSLTDLETYVTSINKDFNLLMLTLSNSQ